MNVMWIGKLLSSWRTSMVGIIGALPPILVQVEHLLDGDPSTVCDWNVVMLGITVIIGFLTARDNKTTSEEAGAAK